MTTQDHTSRPLVKGNVGHFGLGCFGLDILATENAKGGRFGHNHKLWVGCVHALMCDVFLRFNK